MRKEVKMTKKPTYEMEAEGYEWGKITLPTEQEATVFEIECWYNDDEYVVVIPTPSKEDFDTFELVSNEATIEQKVVERRDPAGIVWRYTTFPDRMQGKWIETIDLVGNN